MSYPIDSAFDRELFVERPLVVELAVATPIWTFRWGHAGGGGKEFEISANCETRC